MRLRQAVNGIALSWESELTVRIHFLAMIIVSLIAYFLEVSLFEWIILFSLFGLILGLELMNTALEALCDFVHPENHPAIKRTKDLAAGSVLIASAFAVAIAIVLFVPKIWTLFN